MSALARYSNVVQKVRPQLLSFAWRLAPRQVATVRYMRHRRRVPNFHRPSDISEVILGQILSGEVAEYAPFADKFRVRDHLAEWGHGKLLPEIFGVWEDPRDIEFDSLPAAYILKPTNGTGISYRHTPTEPLDPETVRATMRSAMGTVIDSSEPQYAHITPRCLAEQLIGDGRHAPVDYKFMTCGGIVHGILVCTERETKTRLSFFDTQWNPLPWVKNAYLPSTLPAPPSQLDEMLGVAEDIAARFPQVRVDMYAPAPGETYIGELTFTPQGGYVTYFTNDAVRYLARGWSGTPLGRFGRS